MQLPPGRRPSPSHAAFRSPTVSGDRGGDLTPLRCTGAPGRAAEPQVLEFGPVGYQVEFGDLAVCHGEPEHAQRLVQVPYCAPGVPLTACGVRADGPPRGCGP